MKIIRSTDSKYEFPYIAYISDDVTKSPAMIIQLHGAGERGNGGNELDLVLRHGFGKYTELSELQNCILVMPQCPHNTFWVAKIESLKSFIDHMIDQYNADANRIYLTGLSMGGFGAWYTAMAYPDMFAAIAPCCGGGMPWNASVLTMPVWAFHGDQDQLVLPHNTIDMVEALKETNPSVKFDLYEGVGHNSWEKAFSPELMKWMLEQSK